MRAVFVGTIHWISAVPALPSSIAVPETVTSPVHSSPETGEEIFIVGYHGQPAHDAINVECVDCIYQYLANLKENQLPKRITCVFRDIDTYAAFKTSEIFEKIRKLGI